MKNFRKYGKEPFNIVIVHGGPGATGGVKQVAKTLSACHGVLEPLQTKTSISGQIQELKAVVKENADLPIILIGHSWGAWLSIIFAARYPSYIQKLILISSAPLEEKYALNIEKTRLDRLSKKTKAKVRLITEKLNNPVMTNEEIDRFEKFIIEVDSYNPIFYKKGQKFNVKIFQKVWNEAVQLRKSGQLLKLCRRIKCPVVAIHGDYDPHPYQGVKKPLELIIKNFQFILLKKCGHTPWMEKEAKDKFYAAVELAINV
ncbi:MAG: alpha/beta hydrolase [Parachlamydiales bacterium]|jgi:pimeloyl-ACP methyl ester carboxylesterase